MVTYLIEIENIKDFSVIFTNFTKILNIIM